MQSEENQIPIQDTLEKCYLALELRKVLQIHSKIPKTFVYPIKNLQLHGISFDDKVHKFLLKKDNIKDGWSIKLDNSVLFENTFCQSISEVLVKYFQKEN
ncbi:hypothetical protein GINT2_000759 [Glugoides intestinalis]